MRLCLFSLYYRYRYLLEKPKPAMSSSGVEPPRRKRVPHGSDPLAHGLKARTAYTSPMTTGDVEVELLRMEKDRVLNRFRGMRVELEAEKEAAVQDIATRWSEDDTRRKNEETRVRRHIERIHAAAQNQGQAIMEQ